jgi:hypothetical protein
MADHTEPAQCEHIEEGETITTSHFKAATRRRLLKTVAAGEGDASMRHHSRTGRPADMDRRRLLKLGAGGGLVAVGAALPDRWTRPAGAVRGVACPRPRMKRARTRVSVRRPLSLGSQFESDPFLPCHSGHNSSPTPFCPSHGTEALGTLTVIRG